MESPSDFGIQSANTRLLDAILTHAVDLERLKAGEVAGVLKLLTDLEAELIGKLATLPAPTTQGAELARARVEALLVQTQQTIGTAYRGVATQQADHAATLAGIEARAGAGLIDTGVGIRGAASSVVLTRGQLVALADNTLIVGGADQGAPLANWWAGQSAALQTRFGNTVRLGYAQGEDVDALVRRVRGTRANGYSDGVMAASRRDAETLVRTSVQTVSNTTRQAALDANRDLAGAVMHHSTLDLRTSPICRPRDGLRWQNDDDHAPINHDLPFRVPPLHPRCRSVLQPVLKSWSELTGGKVKDLDASDQFEIERRFRANLAESGLSQEQQNAAIRTTRASMDGQVPNTLTYPEWLQGKNKVEPGFSKRLLGTKRADLVSRGVISVSEAVGPMTLAQLDEVVKARYGR